MRTVLKRMAMSTAYTVELECMNTGTSTSLPSKKLWFTSSNMVSAGETGTWAVAVWNNENDNNSDMKQTIPLGKHEMIKPEHKIRVEK